jgi:hypothetical protein
MAHVDEERRPAQGFIAPAVEGAATAFGPGPVRSCPRCRYVEFEAYSDGDGVIFRCLGCGSCWLVALGWVSRVATSGGRAGDSDPRSDPHYRPGRVPAGDPSSSTSRSAGPLSPRPTRPAGKREPVPSASSPAVVIGLP